MDIQILKCPECGEEFEFDPNSSQKVITSLNESRIQKTRATKKVKAYLQCPNGHTRPYTVKKEY